MIITLLMKTPYLNMICTENKVGNKIKRMNKEIKIHIEHGDWLVSADAKSVLETLCINLIIGSKKGSCCQLSWQIVQSRDLSVGISYDAMQHIFSQPPQSHNLGAQIKDNPLLSNIWELTNCDIK